MLNRFKPTFVDFALPCGAGVILWLSFREDLWWLAIIAIAVFYGRLRVNPARVRVRNSASFSFGFFVPLLWWLSVLGVDAYVLLVLLCCTLTSIVGLVKIPQHVLLGPLVFASVWTLTEILRSLIPWGGFPWGLLAYSQNEGPLVTYARIGGAGLVAFLICLIAAGLVEVVVRKVLLLLSIPLAILFATTFVSEVPSVGQITVAVIQGSVPPTGLNDRNQQQLVLQRHVSITRAFKAQLLHADLVVWPESSAGIDPFADSATYRRIQKVVDEIGRPFLIGATTWRGSPSRPENVGVLWQPVTGATRIYTKNHLVPFGEYVPFRKALETVIKRFEKVPQDFRAGHGGGIFSLPNFRFGDAICFEVAYDDHLSRLVRDGATFITAQSNNSTYLGTEQPEQQFQITRFRAIEHQRAIAVATTTGISGVIAPNGSVLGKTKQGGGEVVVSVIPLVKKIQLVDRAPYLTHFFCFIVLGFALLIRPGNLDKNSITPTSDEWAPPIGSDSD